MRKALGKEQEKRVEEELELPADLKELDRALRMAVREPRMQAGLRALLKSLRRTGRPLEP